MAVILPGVGEGRNATLRAGGIVLALLVSRLALLPDGPWEQDEALFATGVLDYDVVQHRPHPPGFPGFIALGKVLHPIVGDALLALRIWSSLASVLTVVLLAHLLAKLVDHRLALVGALAYAFAPVTWAHAPRAFSDTPALACIVAAIFLFVHKPTARASLGAWALLGFSAAIRAQLAPELAVVAALALWLERSHPRRLVAGIAIAIAVVVVAYGTAALDAESPAAYWRAVSAHLARHESDVPDALAWADLGIVRGLGGSIPAAILCGFTIAGLALALRRDRKLGAWLVALVVVTAWMVLTRHHPGFPRYAVALLLAAMPAIALAIAALPRPAPIVVLVAAAIAGAFTAMPAMFAMHRTPLPPVAALRRIAEAHPPAVAYSHGNFSFVRYHAMSEGLAPRVDDIETPEAIPALPHGAYAIAGRSLHFLPGATVCVETFEDFPEAARALSQERFDATTIARDAILLGAGVHRPERTPDGDPFAWLSGNATLHVPGPSAALVLQLRVPQAPQHVEARIDGDVVLPSTALGKGPHTLRVPLHHCTEGCAVQLLLPDARAHENDRRRLSLRLEAAWSEGPASRGAHRVWSPADPVSMREAGVVIEGAHNPETFGDRRGVWTRARFVATFPASAGKLVVQLARPQHTAGKVVLATEAETQEADIAPEITTVEVRVDPAQGSSRLEIASPTFVPRDVNPQSTDGRELGAILFDIEFVPDDDACGSAKAE